MHPDLASHLHTSECNELIKQLKTCHESNPFGRFIGVCNSADTLVNRCIRQERKQNQLANLQKSKEKQKQYKENLAAQQDSQ